MNVVFALKLRRSLGLVLAVGLFLGCFATFASSARAEETLTVKLASGEGYVYRDTVGKILKGGAHTVTAGESFTFGVSVKKGYEAETLTVTVGGRELKAFDGLYTIKDVQEDVTVVVGGVSAVVAAGKGVKEAEKEAEKEAKKQEAPQREEDKKDLESNLSSTNTEEKRAENDPVPQAGHGREPSGKPAQETVAVTLPTSERYAIEAKDDAGAVTKGGSLTFALTPDKAYSQATPVVSAGGHTLFGKKRGNAYIYTLKNVQQDTAVTVNDADWARNSYLVSLPTGMDYEVYSVQGGTAEGALYRVNHGDQLSFRIEVKNGKEEAALKVTVNGKALTADGGVYTLADIRRDIRVEAAFRNTEEEYTVTFPTGKGYTVTDVRGGDKLSANTYSVPELGVLRFKVKVAKGYDADNLVVLANGDQLYLRNGAYALSEIDADIRVSIEFKQSKKLYVTLVDGAGYSFSDMKGGVAAGSSYAVPFGRDFSFRVDVRSGYDPEALAVKADGKTIKPNSKGVYTLASMEADVRVTASFDEEYASFRVRDRSTDITVSGYATHTPRLSAYALSSQSVEYGRLQPHAGGLRVLGAYDVIVSGAKILGKMGIAFPVDSAYNGEYVNVYRLRSNGRVEVHTARVRKGYVEISTSADGAFLIAGPVEGDILPPKTGDMPNGTLPVLLVGCGAVLLFCAIQRRRPRTRPCLVRGFYNTTKHQS